MTIPAPILLPNPIALVRRSATPGQLSHLGSGGVRAPPCRRAALGLGIVGLRRSVREVTPLWVVVVLGALVLAALVDPDTKIAAGRRFPFVCLCLVLIAIGVHEMVTPEPRSHVTAHRAIPKFPLLKFALLPYVLIAGLLAFTALQPLWCGGGFRRRRVRRRFHQ